MDRRCLPALAELETAFPGKLRVVEGDALRIDHDELMAEPYAVVANLPYNVGTALLVRWLGGEEKFVGEVVSEDDKPVQHTKDQDAMWFMITIIGVPLLVLGLGLFGTLGRRKKKMTNEEEVTP